MKQITESILFAIVCLMLAPAASAQESIMEEVVVTAQKREQTLSEVPISVVTFDGDELDRRAIKDVRDLSAMTPSLAAPTGSSLLTTNFIIRGQGSSTTDPGVEQSVGVFIDGVFRSRSTVALQDFLDVERVEVLKGPQGSILGRNTSAGAISIVLREPDRNFGGDFQADYGRFDTYSLKGSITGPVNEDVSYRLSATYREQGKGYVDNLAGEDLGIQERYMVRGQVKFDISDGTSLRITADISEIDENCCAVAPIFYSDSDIATLTFLGATLPGVSQGRPAVINGVSGVKLDPFRRKVALNTGRNVVIDDQGIAAHLEHSFGSVDLFTIFSYREFEADNIIDFDTTDTPVGIDFPGLVQQESEELSAEVRLSGSSEVLDWVIGAYFLDQDYVGAQTTLAFGIDNQGAALDVDNHAFFGQLIYNITDRLDVTTGLRFTSEKKTATYFGTTFSPLVNANVGVPLDKNDDALLGDIALTWALPDDSGSLYARYGRGYKSPGINLTPFSVISSSVDEFFFDEETSDAYEVGAKLEFERAIVSVAVFLQELDGLQVQVVEATSAVSFVQNVGKAAAA